MKYEEIEKRLQANHFYPAREIKNEKIVGLQVDWGSIILIEERCAKIREVLADEGIKATVSPDKNKGFISIIKEK